MYNRKTISRPRRILSLGCLAGTLVGILFTVSGCGTGEYDRRMRASIQEVGSKAKFQNLLYPNPISIVPGASFRLPALFDNTAKSWAEGNPTETGLAVHPDRLQPPFIKLPGFRYCYEVFPKSGGQEDNVMYCYVAASNTTSQGQEDLIASIQSDLKKKFPDAPEEWETVDLDTPEGATIAVRRTTVSGMQRFDLTPMGGPMKDFDGRMDLYLISTNDNHILIGWRGMSEFVAAAKLFESAEAAMGSTQISAGDTEAAQ